jgi:hypothetical protein
LKIDQKLSALEWPQLPVAPMDRTSASRSQSPTTLRSRNWTGLAWATPVGVEHRPRRLAEAGGGGLFEGAEDQLGAHVVGQREPEHPRRA